MGFRVPVAGINSAGRDARVVVTNRSVQRAFYMFYAILLSVTGSTPSAIPPYYCVRYRRENRFLPWSQSYSNIISTQQPTTQRERYVSVTHLTSRKLVCESDSNQTMVRLSLLAKVKHLEYILAFNRQTSTTCACRRQLLQRYMKTAMQVCFVFFEPSSLIQANFALRRWYDTLAMLHLSTIPSSSSSCLATSVYGGGRGESTGCVHWPLSPAEESASSSSESTLASTTLAGSAFDSLRLFELTHPWQTRCISLSPSGSGKPHSP